MQRQSLGFTHHRQGVWRCSDHIGPLGIAAGCWNPLGTTKPEGTRWSPAYPLGPSEAQRSQAVPSRPEPSPAVPSRSERRWRRTPPHTDHVHVLRAPRTSKLPKLSHMLPTRALMSLGSALVARAERRHHCAAGRRRQRHASRLRPRPSAPAQHPAMWCRSTTTTQRRRPNS